MTDTNKPLPASDPRPEAGSRNMRRMMRSKTLHVTGLMATASFSLAACGAPQVAAPVPAADPALAYTSLEECRAANDVTDAECATAYNVADQQAKEKAPRYASQAECEGQWGPDQCRPLNNTGGGSFFGPLATGFIIGQLLNGGGYRGGGPLYRDRNGSFSNGYGGGYLSRDYRTGRTVANRNDVDVARQAPARAQSRTTVVSRGGFGGGGRGYGG
ncbi:hypothetical protein KOAAANKH_03707 [Brevundimonas sp. NIBR10]|uniref:DUF1190 domain-containing protein n=1 Tax=Brevundimonas sp. NIBR10 TaxID=3015997 RepID=UPI0022F1AA0C|nr:DUF1190 domain-containing protein [Brevundimonas sp. NIBR10]WGM48800.1 hypothetical protein KOAAANKH_03707 [Brevundimonas sp. NIBR10]